MIRSISITTRIRQSVKNMWNTIHAQFIFNSGLRKIVLTTIVMSLMFPLIWLMGYKDRDTVIVSQRNNISQLKSDTVRLKSEMIGYVDDVNAYNELTSDHDYIRYMAFKHSDIVVPKDFNAADLRVLHRMCKRFNVPYSYVYRLIYKESRFIPGLVSSGGARGYMQLMPGTYSKYKARYNAKYNDLDTYTDNQKNLVIGTFMIATMYEKYGDWRKVFACYNTGSPKNTHLAYVNFIVKTI